MIDKEKILAAAGEEREWYLAYQEVGFTPQQAMALLTRPQLERPVKLAPDDPSLVASWREGMM